MAYVDVDKAVGIGYLSDWYQSSIDDTKPPIWTDEHIEELTNDFIVIPKDTPTADFAEVKRGEWTKVEVDGNGYGQIYYQHKECTVSSTELYRCPYQHCPRCGAKMDGGKGE